MKNTRRIVATAMASFVITAGAAVVPVAPATADTHKTAADRSTCNGVGGKVVEERYITLNTKLFRRYNATTKIGCTRLIFGGAEGLVTIQHKTGRGNKEIRTTAYRNTRKSLRSLALTYRHGRVGGVLTVVPRADVAYKKRTGPR